MKIISLYARNNNLAWEEKTKKKVDLRNCTIVQHCNSFPNINRTIITDRIKFNITHNPYKRRRTKRYYPLLKNGGVSVSRPPRNT